MHVYCLDVIAKFLLSISTYPYWLSDLVGYVDHPSYLVHVDALYTP
jgi:hypothetical protein